MTQFKSRGSALDWAVFAFNVVIVWPVASFLITLPGILVGLPVTLVAAVLKRYQWDDMRSCWVFTDRWAIPFQTTNNGCLPAYFRIRWKDKPMWLAIWLWCGVRNPFGGSPLLYWVKPEKIHCFGTTGGTEPSAASMNYYSASGLYRWFWNIYIEGWRASVWAAKARPDGYTEVRFGWKYRNNFEVFDAEGRVRIPYTMSDSGRRSL